MKLVNIAHGDFILIGGVSLAHLVITATGLHPLVALIIGVPMHGPRSGYLLQRFILTRTMGEDILLLLLVSFAPAVIRETACCRFSPPTPSACQRATLNAQPHTFASIHLGFRCPRSRGCGRALIAGSRPAVGTQKLVGPSCNFNHRRLPRRLVSRHRMSLPWQWRTQTPLPWQRHA